MIEVICSLIAAGAALLSAWIARSVSRQTGLNERKVEMAKLQMKMISANIMLTTGVAAAIKNGHANGEIKAGLEAVEKAQNEYDKFLNDLAIEELK